MPIKGFEDFYVLPLKLLNMRTLLVIREKYLSENDYVFTEQLYQASLKYQKKQEL